MDEFPAFYQPERIGSLFYPDMAAIAEAANEAALPPAAADEQNVHLLIIDMQVDFCHDDGTLYVPGSQDDLRRLIEFIFRHGARISAITCTLDSHLPYQIFHPSWWADEDGNNPPPLTIITAKDVASGHWRPLVMPDWSREYVRRLEENASKQLTIWPFHVMIGGMGNALDPSLWSAVVWHSLARKSQPAWLVKGRIPETEHYSALQPEIPVPGRREGGQHQGLLKTLAEADQVFVAGEAQSHCVLETLEDIVEAFRGQPEQLQKFYVLTDCTSSVLHPEIDFDALSREQFDRFAGVGVNFIESTNPLPFVERGQADVDGTAPVRGLHRLEEWQEPS